MKNRNQKIRNIILISVFAVLILAVSFFSSSPLKTPERDESFKEISSALQISDTESLNSAPNAQSKSESLPFESSNSHESEDLTVSEETKEDKSDIPEESSKPEENSKPEESSKPEEPSKPEEKNTCTITVSCKTILDNKDKLKKDKLSLVPKDGYVLHTVTVEIKPGDSVFDILKRVLREHKIHFEFSQTPGLNSAYIEGIANLYEFDCGPLSGWMYKVNGKFPNYGCSACKVKPGDKIEWLYTCDLGKDIGNEYKK